MTYLDAILESRRASVERSKAVRPIAALQTAVSARRDHRDFSRALQTGPRPAIIAEFKRASPSAGTIAANADVRRVATSYERAGAAALSVLTETERFGGALEDLQDAHEATSLPVLCKDFVIDDQQIWEAAAFGADAVLLIVAAMERDILAGRIALAAGIGLTVLVEVHDERQLDDALSAGARVIGVNNRDLHTFVVDTSTAIQLRARMPKDVISVAESGYRSNADIAACADAGYDAVLVGEALMRETDPGRALSELRSRAS